MNYVFPYMNPRHMYINPMNLHERFIMSGLRVELVRGRGEA